ncbi:FxSxx-COOH cyclophane-containing RiPP peptide [Phytohabitans aurantiacus]|uniref:FxSxx-COOH cyclophane-containing RiPP peptide n=1 Tax=Phytohabitans aurantiacus TaxID=3016789 RepID=UPI00389B052A
MESSGDRVSRIVDVSKLPLSELATVDKPRLQKSLREVVDQVERQHEIVAGFGSAI